MEMPRVSGRGLARPARRDPSRRASGVSNASAPCPFCDPAPERIFYAGDHVVGIWDAFPVSPGHALVVPERHVASWFDATAEERHALVAGIDIAKAEIEARHRPAAYNIGINVGEAAGQTVFHLHVHVIPRYMGDVEDPRGGVRHVLPKRANYLTGPGK
jgi:diadenosine tetraphosphate (Ap4A) HIT family hydrolase